MSKPTLPVVNWATDENDSEGYPIKIQPPEELQATGLLKGQPMGRQWFNYILNNHSEWLKFLSEPTVGEVKSYNIAQPSLLTTGWVLSSSTVGTATTSTRNLYTYEYRG